MAAEDTTSDEVLDKIKVSNLLFKFVCDVCCFHLAFILFMILIIFY